MTTDGLARFDAHFDSECDHCLNEILQGDEMAFDKLEGQYICGECLIDRETDRSG